MHLVFSGSLFLAVFLMPLTPLTAETCNGRARTCVIKWGAPRAACYDSFRLAACEKTGKYVAPNGNVWPVDRAQKTGAAS